MMTTMRSAALAAVTAAVLATGAWAGAPDAAATDSGQPRAGYRATTLTIESAQLQNVRRGIHVDVLVSFEAVMAKGEREWVTATILQNVLVLGVAASADPKAEGTISLMLNPNECQYAALAAARGYRIHLATRSDGDAEMHPMEMASFRKLFR